MALTDAEREALRLRNIQERDGAGAEQNGPSQAQRDLALRQALKEREYAEKEDRDVYDDEPVMFELHKSENTNTVIQYCMTKHGRTYSRLVGTPEWVEVGAPLPRTHARRTYNGIRKAEGEVSEVRSRL